MILRIDYQEPDVMLDLWAGTTATFSGIDRFGDLPQTGIDFILERTMARQSETGC